MGLMAGVSGGTLRRNALTATDVVAMATATYAPTAALYFNTPDRCIVLPALRLPFAFILSTIAMLIVRLAWHSSRDTKPAPVGITHWIRSALGQRVGLWSAGWSLQARSW